MSKRSRALAITVTIGVLLTMLALYLHHHTVAVIQPRGPIAAQERSLMLTAALMGLVVIIPVFILTIFIALRYRATNKHTKTYSPTWSSSRWLETIWWGIPLAIVAVLSVIAWHSSYALDPFKPLASKQAPLTIQVVSLDWKWLFIYPEQHVASVNQVQLPLNRPVTFEITSDTVMNSFWIPQLSGQIYAMPGMSTELNLMAGKTGDYYGSSANVSGSGFSGMHFTAHAESATDFSKWTAAVKHGSPALTLDSYNQLTRPSKNEPVRYYTLGTNKLYDYIVMKYMEPGAEQ